MYSRLQSVGVCSSLGHSRVNWSKLYGLTSLYGRAQLSVVQRLYGGQQLSVLDRLGLQGLVYGRFSQKSQL